MYRALSYLGVNFRIVKRSPVPIELLLSVTETLEWKLYVARISRLGPNGYALGKRGRTPKTRPPTTELPPAAPTRGTLNVIDMGSYYRRTRIVPGRMVVE